MGTRKGDLRASIDERLGLTETYADGEIIDFSKRLNGQKIVRERLLWQIQMYTGTYFKSGDKVMCTICGTQIKNIMDAPFVNFKRMARIYCCCKNYPKCKGTINNFVLINRKGKFSLLTDTKT